MVDHHQQQQQQQQQQGEDYYYPTTTTTSTQENVAAAAADSPLSGDETYELNASSPSPKKRRGAQKKVITIPINGEGDGSISISISSSTTKSRGGEVYPPPDSWSWRKYGQKPIKGSPYPRGYYRCSSSKGCPARKQVERSRHDPNMLLITYSCEHNHSLPTTTKHNHHRMSAATTSGATEIKSTTSTSTSSSNNINLPVPQSTHPEFVVPDFDSENIRFSEFARELGWFSNVESTFFESSTLMGPTWSEIDTAGMLNIGEEDESLFGDLGELPECSTVFRRVMVGETPCGAGS